MDKNVLKRFAIESRKHLHEKVADRYALYYLDEEFDEVENNELYTFTNEKHNLVLTKEQYEHRQKILNKKDRYGKDHVIEEAAFTWFNRFICLRYMELHNFLPLGKNNESLDIRVLSSRDGNKEPEILKRNNLTNNSLDINVDIDKLEKIADINEKFEKVLLKVCEKMGRVLPQIFDGETDYIELLMPKNQLNVDSFLDKLLKEVPEDNFNDIEVIGWLYQYYNQSEKDRVMKEKRAYKKSEIPYVTQIFTPDWIVKYMVENSLGRLWIENTGDESLESEFKYFIKDNIEIKAGGKDNRRGEACEPESVGAKLASPMLPENITFIDPCMGSGHILVYAFEVFMKLYISAGYNKKDIPELILKNNLYGLDIDDRAGQFAIISVMLKAREYDSEIFNKIDFNSLNILSISESNIELTQHINTIKDKEVREMVDYLINTFENGKEIGSLLIVEDKDYDKVTKYFEQATPNIFNRLLWEGLKDIIRVAKILSKKYDVVVTNPPYMGANNFNKTIKEFLSRCYESGKNDLCTAFMNIPIISNCGYLSMINQQAWMFKKIYAETRKNLLEHYNITSMLHMGMGAFGTDFGTTAWVAKHNSNVDGIYYRLADSIDKERTFNDKKDKDRYFINRSVFTNMPNYCIYYWLSERMKNIFIDNEKLDDKVSVKKGFSSGDNARFFRLWHEVKNIELFKDKKWVPMTMGGDYRRWWGNIDNVVMYSNDGAELKKFKGSVMRNVNYYFKNCISWNDTSSSGKIAFRYHNYGSIPNASGPCIYAEETKLKYVLGLMNSIVAEKIMSYIAPSNKFEVGEVGIVPYIEIIDLNIVETVNKNIEISKNDWDSFETSWDFKKHPLV